MRKIIFVLLLIACCCTTARADLIAHWTFDNDSIVPIGDNTVYSNVLNPGQYNAWVEGSPANAPFTSGEGVFGEAILFNGTSNFLGVWDDSNPGLQFADTDMCTVIAWIKTDNVGIVNDWNGIVTKGDGSWQLSAQGGGDNIRWQADNSIYGPTLVNDNTWHMVVGTYDGYTHKLYIDGVLDAFSATQASFTPIDKSTNPVFIGNTDRSTDNRWYNGWMDDVRLYNSALTHQEINLMYFAATGISVGIPAQNPDPVPGADVITKNTTVSWDPGWDPNDTITFHQLYTDAYNANPADPNLYLEATITNDGSRASYVLAGLPNTKLVSWRVDEVYEKGVITGPVWSFQKNFIVLTQEPADVLLWPGDTAIFSTAAIVDESETLLYQWYKYDPALLPEEQVPLVDGGDISGATTDTLSIANLEGADDGQYVCAIFTAATFTDPVITRLANLTVYRMIAHWTLDDDSTSVSDPNYQDATGTYPASPVGTFTSEPGIVGSGQALRFDGTNWLNIGAGTDPGMRFDYTNRCTLAAWVKSADMVATHAGIVTKGDTSWRMARNADTDFAYFTGDNGANSVVSTTAVNDDQWHLLVALFDRTSTKIYVDGVLEMVDVHSDKDISKSTASVMIGNNSTFLDRAFQGLIDDVRIYNYVLTREAIAQLYYDVTGQSVCLDGGVAGDVTGDCAVTLADIEYFASEWLDTAGYYNYTP